MAETDQPYLRIYCVCGQKMKVTGSLFGRPGKCVACRQKIRIPRFDEIPDGTDEIHLKDHPEYLRGKRRSPARKSSDVTHQRDVVLRHKDDASDEPHTPEEEHVELTDSHVVSTVALDVLEPLRNLFSIGNKLQRQLETLNKSDTIYAEVKGRLARVKKVRADLEEQLRQMLMEVAIELAMTQDKIAQTQLSARIGEISYDDFKGDIYKQRSRRDSLERRQQNLRGWIATTDVRSAGGFADVPPDSIPEDGFRVVVPAEPRTTAPLVDVHTSGLREAFEARSKAERKLAELERMRDSGASQVDWKQARANTKSARAFADANIEFRRDRLQQLRKDYDEDLETLAAQLDMTRNRMQSGQLDRPAYDKEEKKLARGQADLKKALSIIDRALSANSAPDVPQAKGTFLGRMAANEQGERDPDTLENALAWTGAALIAVAAFLPMIGNLSPFGAFLEFDGPGSWAFLLLFLFAGAIAAAVFVRAAQVRTAVVAALWIVGILLLTWIFRESLYSIGATSARFRTGPTYLLRPGFLAVLLAIVAVASSAALTARRAGWWPVGPVAALVAGVLSVATVGSDVGGMYRPQPALDVSVKSIAEGRGQLAQVTVTNDGGRSLFLLPPASASDARAAYHLFIERKSGQNSWAEVSPSTFASSGGRDTERVAPGESLVKTVSLANGDYRALLVCKAMNDRQEAAFTIAGEPSLTRVEEPEAPIEVPPTTAPENAEPVAAEEPPDIDQPEQQPAAQPEPESPDEAVAAEELPPALEVTFQGAGARGEGQYRLSFIVAMPGEPSQRVFVSLGEEIVDGWVAATYDPGSNQVTLSRGESRRALAPGEIARMPD